MKHIVSVAVKPVMLCLSTLFNHVEAQPKQERFQRVNMPLLFVRSAQSFKPVHPFFMHCPKKVFGVRLTATISRPPRDQTDTRVALSISIKPFIKPKTHKL